mmetsp:Transcript_30987/g.100973  ORF Transcript_30987/g.100973 Transcript_30987/m.100973 type:complete len:212 (+) Transcript_30987:2865-3500(+)
MARKRSRTFFALCFSSTSSFTIVSATYADKRRPLIFFDSVWSGLASSSPCSGEDASATATSLASAVASPGSAVAAKASTALSVFPFGLTTASEFVSLPPASASINCPILDARRGVPEPEAAFWAFSTDERRTSLKVPPPLLRRCLRFPPLPASSASERVRISFPLDDREGGAANTFCCAADFSSGLTEDEKGDDNALSMPVLLPLPRQQCC